MSSQTTMDHLSTGVDQLNISDKRSPEYTYSNGMLFFSPDTMTRDYILSHQPWDSDALPQQYVPTGKQRWFPPMFYLGVPLTTEEAIHFARHLGVLRGKGDYNTFYTVARHLSQLCGFVGPDSLFPLHSVKVKTCDTNGLPWMITFMSNYQIPENLDYGEPFTMVVDALDGAFGGSKKLEWWLEYSLNHSPKADMWLKLKPDWVHDWDKTYDYED